MSHKFFRRDSKTEKSVANGTNNNNNNNNNKKDFSERKTQLTPQEYRVTQERQTERPFSNRYNRFWEPGTYHCIVCNAELFKSNTKFESKSGWPAFSNVVDPKRVKLTPDLSHIGANLLLLIAKPDLARTEVSCAMCNAHLGHLFKDGPKPTGLRYCINSSSLNFIAVNPIEYADCTDFEDVATSDEKEFPCNPANSCSMASKGITNENSSKDFQNNSTVCRKSQTLPPMATLCLNTQPCQKVDSSIMKPSKIDLSQSTEEITSKISSNFNGNSNSNNTGNNNSNTGCVSSFSRTSSSRFPSSKGASLTAARISFFQNLTAGETKIGSGVSKWGPGSGSTSTISTTSNSNFRPFTNRFVNSISSGNLGTKSVGTKNNNGNSFINQITRRSSNNGLFSNSTGVVGIEKISSAPVPLKETAL